MFRCFRLPTVLFFLVGALAVAGSSPGGESDARFDRFGGLGGAMGADAAVGGGMVSLDAQFTKPTAGRPARLLIKATMTDPWYIYSITQPPGGPRATRITVNTSDKYRLSGPFQASPPPKKKPEPIFDNLIVETHYGAVLWHAPIEFAAGVDPGRLVIEGAINVQLCKPGRCNPPEDIPFAARLGPDAAAVPTTPAAAAPVGTVDYSTLAIKLGLAFVGGLLLNLMPCVLPVISLKLLSFIEQAGESRSRVFVLNLWYAIGLLSVFMVLAVLAAGLKLGWGQQFTLPWFKVAMTGLVFVMALAFLGVWEIPIPGFMGSGRAGRLQVKEGASGAFSKGVFTTILATPCSGPFLGPVFGFLLNQPPQVVYLVFGAVGLGMASPYLVVGAFPELLRFLPKPGAWMDTLKQLMGFLLLGTVVFLFTTMGSMYFIPTLTLLVGLWFACWWIGRTPLTAGPAGRTTAWLGGIATAALVGLLAFTILLHKPQMPWRPFSPEALAQARAEGKTVMVDFSADWCLTCKTTLKFSVDTEQVREVIKNNRVVPMLADWTDRSPVIKQTLNELGYNSIPLLAIWPAGAGDDEVIILADWVRESQVVEALEAAGPSATTTPGGS